MSARHETFLEWTHAQKQYLEEVREAHMPLRADATLANRQEARIIEMAVPISSNSGSHYCIPADPSARIRG